MLYKSFTDAYNIRKARSWYFPIDMDCVGSHPKFDGGLSMSDMRNRATLTKNDELEPNRFLKICQVFTLRHFENSSQPSRATKVTFFFFFSCANSLFLPPHTSDIMATLRLNEKSSKDILLLHKYVKSSIPIEFSKDVNLEVSNVTAP